MGNVESNDKAAGQVKHVGARLRRAVLFRQVLVASVFAIVSVVSDTELGHGFWSVETMVFAFATLGSLAAFLVMLVVHLARRRWIAARGYGLLLVAFVASMRLSGYVDEHHERTAKQAAQPIMQALDAYKADAGRYPQSLEELVPGLLPKPHGYWHYFDSEAGQWRMHD